VRRLALGIGIGATFVLSGAAGAVIGSRPSPAEPPRAPVALSQLLAGAGHQDGEGIHGGPIARFHGAGRCDLTAVGSLPGNWTHGDYVAAVAQADPTQASTAARSDCGKPMVAVTHGNGNANGHPTGKPESPGRSEEHVPEDLPDEGPVGS